MLTQKSLLSIVPVTVHNQPIKQTSSDREGEPARQTGFIQPHRNAENTEYEDKIISVSLWDCKRDNHENDMFRLDSKLTDVS